MQCCQGSTNLSKFYIIQQLFILYKSIYVTLFRTGKMLQRALVISRYLSRYLTSRQISSSHKFNIIAHVYLDTVKTFFKEHKAEGHVWRVI